MLSRGWGWIWMPACALNWLISQGLSIPLTHAFKNVLGVVNPDQEEMHNWPTKLGAVWWVDGAQSAPHMKIDVRTWMWASFCFQVYSGQLVLVFFTVKKSVWNKYRTDSVAWEWWFRLWSNLLVGRIALKFELEHKYGGIAIGLAAAVDYLEYGCHWSHGEVIAYVFSKLQKWRGWPFMVRKT